MANYPQFDLSSIVEGVSHLDGYVKLDSSGRVTNQLSAIDAVTDGYADAWSNPLVLPKGITSITLDGSTAGLYHVVLQSPWYELLDAEAHVIGTSIKSGTVQTLQWNPKGTAVAGGASAQTIDLQYQEGGSAHALTSCGLAIHLVIKTLKTQI